MQGYDEKHPDVPERHHLEVPLPVGPGARKKHAGGENPDGKGQHPAPSTD